MGAPIQLPPITSEDAAPAQVLRVELRTRIATRLLHYRSGDEETAAKSIYELFPTTRKLLVAHPKAVAFDTVAVFGLNELIRPYTARWHKLIVNEHFRDEPARRQFRLELRRLQVGLAELERLLKDLAGGPTKQSEAEQRLAQIVAAASAPDGEAVLGGDVWAGIGTQVGFAGGELPMNLGRFATADNINEAEWRFIQARRLALSGVAPGDPAAQRKLNERPPNVSGLCLSGGG